MAVRVPNKTWYSSSSSVLLEGLDFAFSWLFGTDFTKSVMMNGYGWDWHVDPRGHFSHKVEELGGKHAVINHYANTPTNKVQ